MRSRCASRGVRGERRACQGSSFSSHTGADAMRSCCGWPNSMDQARVPRGADLTAGRPIAGSPDAYLNLIHVEDAAAAVMAAAASGPVTARTYAVPDGHPPTRGEYAGWLATQLGVPQPVFEAGSGLGKRVRNARAVLEHV